MCLGIPGQIIQVADSALQLAVVDVCGVKREVNISLIYHLFTYKGGVTPRRKGICVQS